MSRLTRDETAESVSRDQILRCERGQGNIHFPYSADHEQDWQPYLVGAKCDDIHHVPEYVVDLLSIHTFSVLSLQLKKLR